MYIRKKQRLTLSGAMALDEAVALLASRLFDFSWGSLNPDDEPCYMWANRSSKGVYTKIKLTEGGFGTSSKGFCSTEADSPFSSTASSRTSAGIYDVMSRRIIIRGSNTYLRLRVGCRGRIDFSPSTDPDPFIHLGSCFSSRTRRIFVVDGDENEIVAVSGGIFVMICVIFT